jgi:hypothetical protein
VRDSDREATRLREIRLGFSAYGYKYSLMLLLLL